MEHLEFVLKKFNKVAALTDNLLMEYLQNGLRLSIWAQLNKKDHNQDKWQAVIKQILDTKTKLILQALLLVRECDIQCIHDNKSLKNEELMKQKNSEAKMNHYFFANNSNRGNRRKLSQVLGFFSIKILVQIGKANKANFLTLQQLVVTLLSWKKTRSEMTKIWASLSVMSVTRKGTMAVSVMILVQ